MCESQIFNIIRMHIIISFHFIDLILSLCHKQLFILMEFVLSKSHCTSLLSLPLSQAVPGWCLVSIQTASPAEHRPETCYTGGTQNHPRTPTGVSPSVTGLQKLKWFFCCCCNKVTDYTSSLNMLYMYVCISIYTPFYTPTHINTEPALSSSFDLPLPTLYPIPTIQTPLQLPAPHIHKCTCTPTTIKNTNHSFQLSFQLISSFNMSCGTSKPFSKNHAHRKIT